MRLIMRVAKEKKLIEELTSSRHSRIVWRKKRESFRYTLNPIYSKNSIIFSNLIRINMGMIKIHNFDGIYPFRMDNKFTSDSKEK